MACTCRETYPSLVEQAVREDFLPPSMEGWRCYRIEYGHECSCPEGLVFLPPDVDPQRLEDWLEYEKKCYLRGKEN